MMFQQKMMKGKGRNGRKGMRSCKPSSRTNSNGMATSKWSLKIPQRKRRQKRRRRIPRRAVPSVPTRRRTSKRRRRRMTAKLQREAEREADRTGMPKSPKRRRAKLTGSKATGIGTTLESKSRLALLTGCVRENSNKVRRYWGLGGSTCHQ